MTPEQAAEEYAEQWTSGYYNTFTDHLKDKGTVKIAFLAGHAHAQNRWVKVTPDKTLVDFQKIVANKHNLGNSLVTGHKASYFNEATELYVEYLTSVFTELPQPPEHG